MERLFGSVLETGQVRVSKEYLIEFPDGLDEHVVKILKLLHGINVRGRRLD